MIPKDLDLCQNKPCNLRLNTPNTDQQKSSMFCTLESCNHLIGTHTLNLMLTNIGTSGKEPVY